MDDDSPYTTSLQLPEDLYRYAPMYDGYVEGTNGSTGKTEILFPSFKEMADFVEGCDLGTRTEILPPSLYYCDAVWISVSVAPR